MITKLKYAGVKTEDLIHIYILYIRSVLEYCSVLWHSTLTVEQSQAIERVQKTCLKIILGSEYTSYADALGYTGLELLSERRETRCLQFGLKCLVHPLHHRMFPANPQLDKNKTARTLCSQQSKNRIIQVLSHTIHSKKTETLRKSKT